MAAELLAVGGGCLPGSGGRPHGATVQGFGHAVLAVGEADFLSQGMVTVLGPLIRTAGQAMTNWMSGTVRTTRTRSERHAHRALPCRLLRQLKQTPHPKTGICTISNPVSRALNDLSYTLIFPFWHQKVRLPCRLI